MKNQNQFKHVIVAIDVAIFTLEDSKLKVALIKVKSKPFENYWTLPGGMVATDESIDEAVVRHTKEKVPNTRNGLKMRQMTKNSGDFNKKEAVGTCWYQGKCKHADDANCEFSHDVNKFSRFTPTEGKFKGKSKEGTSKDDNSSKGKKQDSCRKPAEKREAAVAAEQLEEIQV